MTIIDYVPALSILLTLLIVIKSIIRFIKAKEYSDLTIRCFVLAVLFTLVLVVHLFKAIHWSEHLVILGAGVLFGITLVSIIQVVIRDRNVSQQNDSIPKESETELLRQFKLIQELVTKIDNTTVESQKKVEMLSQEYGFDILINRLIETGADAGVATTKILKHWQEKNWIFVQISPAFDGTTGTQIIFLRKANSTPKIYYQPDSNIEGHIYPASI